MPIYIYFRFTNSSKMHRVSNSTNNPNKSPLNLIHNRYSGIGSSPMFRFPGNGHGKLFGFALSHARLPRKALVAWKHLFGHWSEGLRLYTGDRVTDCLACGDSSGLICQCLAGGERQRCSQMYMGMSNEKYNVAWNK